MARAQADDGKSGGKPARTGRLDPASPPLRTSATVASLGG
jgi:hypothetical protein